MNEGLKTAWDDYNKSSHKKKVLMDQINILSVRRIEDGVVYLHEISPMLLGGYPYKEENVWKRKMSNLPGWAIRMLSVTGLAFRIEKKLYLVDEMTFRSFNDMFGWTRNASEPSIWRDFHLAQLFKERDYAYVLYTMKDNYRVVSAIHKTALDAISGDLYQAAEHYIKDGAEIVDFFYNDIRFQVELALPREKYGWKQTLVIRDSCIGRESLTFINAWRKKDALIYTGVLKQKHRSETSLEELIPGINDLINSCYKKMEVTKMTPREVFQEASSSIGMKKKNALSCYMGQYFPMEDAESALIAVGSFKGIGNDTQEIAYRKGLGNLLGGVTVYA